MELKYSFPVTITGTIGHTFKKIYIYSDKALFYILKKIHSNIAMRKLAATAKYIGARSGLSWKHGSFSVWNGILSQQVGTLSLDTVICIHICIFIYWYILEHVFN